MARVIGYARVSTSKDEQVSLSLPNQVLAIQQYAESRNMQAVIFEEQKSGSLHVRERPQLKRALDELQKGDTFYVVAEDRLARNMNLIGYLRILIEVDKGALLVCGDVVKYEDPLANLMAGAMRGMSAQMYRDAISSKVLAASKSRRKQLKVWGAYVPYGFVADAEQNLFISPEQQETIKLIRTLSSQGMKPTSIAKHLNADKVPLPIVSKTSRGEWYAAKVTQVIEKDYSDLIADLEARYGHNAYRPGFHAFDHCYPDATATLNAE